MFLCLSVSFLLSTWLFEPTKSQQQCPVFETNIQHNLATNSSHLLNYRMPPCPTNYGIYQILAAQAINASSFPPRTVWNITYQLTSAVCKSQPDGSCLVSVPLGGMVVGGNGVVAVTVNYTCQMAQPIWSGESSQTPRMNVTSGSNVTYTRVEMDQYGQNYNCILSSSVGTSISWRWWTRSCADHASALECVGGNGQDMPTRDLNVSWSSCMGQKSARMIKFIFDAFFCRDDTILVAIQAPRGSDLRVDCLPAVPMQNNYTLELEFMSTECNRLHWSEPPTTMTTTTTESRSTTTSTASGVRSPSSSTTPSKPSTTLISAPSLPPETPSTPPDSSGTSTTTDGEKGGENGEIHNRLSTPAPSTGGIDTVGLAFGLGFGVGILFVLIIIVVAILCIRNRVKKKHLPTSSVGSLVRSDTSESNAPGFDADGGFVSADDIFTRERIHQESAPTHTDDNTTTSPGDRDNEAAHNAINNDYAIISTPPVVAPPEPPPPRTRQPLTLTRKLFAQIAAIAKKEEQKENAKRKSKSTRTSAGQNEEVSSSAVGESALVDRWLYSSTLSGFDTVSNRPRDYDI